MKKLLVMLMSLCFCFIVIFGAACSSDKDKSALDDGVLTIGYTIYPPMNYYEGSDFVGFDTELAQKVGEILNVKVEFVEINWDNKVISLNSKEIDAIWNGMTITEELKQAMAISNSYLENKQVVVCQKVVADNYKSKEDLKKAGEILVEAGSAGESAITEVGLTASTMTAQKDTLLEVKTSSSKIAVIDKNMAEVMIGEGTNYSDLTFIDVGFEVEEFGIGFRKNDTKTRDKVNEAIEQLKTNGTFDELKKKYFGA